MEAPSIEISGLAMRYPGGQQALAGVDLTIAPGQRVALVGSNGSGKSTMLRCLVRLLEPTEGRVVINGTDMGATNGAQLRRARTDVGFVFQRFHLVPRLTAFHNVLHGAVGRVGARCLWPATTRDDVRVEAMECLERVGLAGFAGRRVDTLSGGQQQRVAIARMLLQRPKVILADEPVASLDPAAGIGVMELLREVVVERGLTAVIALHQLDLALAYTERVVGLQHGRLVLDRDTGDCAGSDFDTLYTRVAS